ncbi:MAG: XcyI family restriction endonuclease, partial [Pseudomonadota bacterium]|nr:XcyI family restriction endonuclease [Pseudomonadota bacterium]
MLEDLALLTVGPQLRGGHNVKLGLAGIVKVFDAISSIVAHAAVKTEPNCIELKNAAGCRVLIAFSSGRISQTPNKPFERSPKSARRSIRSMISPRRSALGSQVTDSATSGAAASSN